MIPHTHNGARAAIIPVNVQGCTIVFITLNECVKKPKSSSIKPLRELGAQLVLSVRLLTNDSAIAFPVLNQPSGHSAIAGMDGTPFGITCFRLTFAGQTARRMTTSSSSISAGGISLGQAGSHLILARTRFYRVPIITSSARCFAQQPRRLAPLILFPLSDHRQPLLERTLVG